jgi:hypothetical protein
MSTPITFSVAPAVRTGTFTTAAFAKPAGYTQIFWELAIPNAAEYEDPANQFIARLLVNGVDPASTWVGGHVVNKQGVVNPPPAIEYDIGPVPTGATLQVQVAITGTFTVGIQNGAIT